MERLVAGRYPLEMADTPLDRVARAAADVKRAEESLRLARVRLRAEIVAATEAGASMTSVARTLGVSRQRVKQIVGR